MAIQDNTPSPAPTTDVGLKISKPTYNAYQTASENLLFSSSWPSLQIAFEITITTAEQLASYASTNTEGQYAIPHNLGYSPFSFYWQPSEDASSVTNGSIRSIANVDDTYAYINVSSVATGFTLGVPINIKCFALDLSKDVDYSVPVGNAIRLPYDPNFGIKVAKTNQSPSSKDLRNFVIHSRCQSPLVLAVKTQSTSPTSNGTTVQYTNKLGYPTWNYGFIKTSASAFHYAPYFSQLYPQTFTDGIITDITYQTGAPFHSIGATLVILRDPFFAPTVTGVTY